MNGNLKIVHCANFSYLKNGEVFYATDRKVTYGLMSQGHFVYDFSYRDQAKLHRFLGFKKKSIKRMNQDLIETCQNIQPDLLLLAKSEYISVKTLRQIRKRFPKMKIGQWFVDFVEREEASFFEKFHYIDAFFQTCAAELKELSNRYPNTYFSFIPNLTDPAFEKKLDHPKEYDVIYIARDHKEDNRYKFAVLLKEYCDKHGISLKIFASLGNSLIFGQEYYDAISKAKIAINFNRTDFIDRVNEQKFMGSSDRMNHMMGIGTCLFSPKIQGLDILYEDQKDVVYFENFDDCCTKIKEYLSCGGYDVIAEQGRKKVFEVSNAKKVTKYMIETLYQQPYSEVYEWSKQKYYQGRQVC